MTNNPKRYLITSALPYANGPIHIGHLVGAYLPADIYVRYLRMMGRDVVFVCGSDQHGAAITIKAKKQNTTAKYIANHYHYIIKKSFEDIGMSFDIYHQTSASLHHETAQEFFRTINDKEGFLKETSEQYYDASYDQFLADRYITGECPKCSNPEAYGDQCERCGSALSPTELINPTSTLSGEAPVLKKTTHWYLPLDKYETWLRTWLEEGSVSGSALHNPNDWKNHVLGQCRSWLDGGLKPRPITRDLDWGIDVPQEIKDSEGKKLYVWFDAPIGYISATKQWAIDNNKDWKPYWQDKDTKLVHFIGKDNIVFHCIIFPAILKEHGDYILPENVPANQFMNLEGKKLSTSRNWAVWLHEYLEDFADVTNYKDLLRYALIKIMPEQRDSDFSWQHLLETNNNELVNGFANFVNRVIVLTNKYYEGEVPAYDETLKIIGTDSQEVPYQSMIETIATSLSEVQKHIEQYDFRAASRAMMNIAALGDALLQYNEPWKQQKTNPELVKVVMNIGLQIVATLSVACRPFMPFTSDKLRDLLNMEPIQEQGEWQAIAELLTQGKAIIKAGHTINKPSHLFARLNQEKIDTQIAKMEAAALANNPTYEAVKELCTFEYFSKVDIRTGTIKAAEKVKKTKKLLKLTVDIGFEERTIVSGIAEYFKPEDIIDKQVLVVVNLAPKVMKKIESQGMVLMAEDATGCLDFVSPSTDLGNGFVVK